MTHAIRTTVGLVLLGVVTAGSGAVAQEPADQVQVDALQCWRDVRSSSVRVGEPFTMTITCVAVETESATTVPNEVALAPETIDLSPFEVIEGERHQDIRDGPWRFFQYRYRLRVIDEELFGEDAEIPAVELRYHIERRLDGGSALPGRELVYVIPAEPIRIESLVPENAVDIRTLAAPSFGEADTRRFQADLAILGASAVGVFAFGFLFLAAIQLVRQWRGAAPKSEKLVPDSAIVARALSELTTLQRRSQEQGWSDDLISRTLAAFRLAGATALDAPVAQERVEPRQPNREGQLQISRGVWRPRTTALSSSITAAELAAEIERREAVRPGDPAVEALSELRDALVVFTTARYSPNGNVPTDEMTTGLDKGIGVVRRLRFWALAPVQRTTRFIDSTREWWQDVWTR